MASRAERTRHRSSTTERYRFDFIDDGERAVVPILKRDRDGIRALVGTGFFVANDGVFATAKHVFTGSDVAPGDAFEVMYRAVDETILGWPVDSIVPHDDVDLAVCTLLQPSEHEGFVLDHPVVAFMNLVPEFKEVLGTFAFSHTEVHPPVEEELEGELELVQHIKYRSHWEIGTLEEIHEGAVPFVPGLCYRTSVLVEGGASGGPVVNSNGFVVGVNSRGMAPSGPVCPYSYNSSVLALGEISISAATLTELRLASQPTRMARCIKL